METCTPETVRALYDYDPLTGIFFWKNGEVVKGSIRAPTRANDYRIISVQAKYVKAHRAAFAIMLGRWPKQVDHANGIHTDNRWCNLRECEPWQNCVNRKARKENTFGRRGVGFRYGKYTAKLKVNGKYIWLGNHDSATLAGLAYDEAAIKYHGEFARLNYPKPFKRAA